MENEFNEYPDQTYNPMISSSLSISMDDSNTSARWSKDASRESIVSGEAASHPNERSHARRMLSFWKIP